MKILLTGASGLLGSAFAKAAFRRRHDVTGIVGSWQGPIEGLSQTLPIDLTRLDEVERCVLETFPDAIVNCAALSIPDQCEREPQKAQTLNVDLPQKLALLSRHLFARYIHISTDQVFDGVNPPYQISDETRPLSRYAQLKQDSETRVLDLASEFASIIRIPLLNGNSPRGDRSVHEQLFSNWRKGIVPLLFEDEIRQPCLAENLAEVMVELCEREDLRGKLHWAGAESLSRFEIGRRLLHHFGLPPDWIKVARQSDNARLNPRPPDLSLDLQPLAGKLKTRPQSFNEQLDSLIVPTQHRSWYHSL